MATLETQLIKAVQEENLDEVRSLIERGAKINISTSGRTPLSIAAYLGNIPMLELLLHSGQFSPHNETSTSSFEQQNNAVRKQKLKKKDAESVNENNLPQNNRRAKRKRPSTTGEGCRDGNNGYYVFVHEDGTNEQREESKRLSDINKNKPTSIDDVTTPEGMDNLEWDMEVQEGQVNSDEDDQWSNQYRWYAKILANTYCTVQESPHNICDINLQDSYGRCAIHYAAEYGHPNAVKLLINAGARVDMGDVDNLTPLHLAANKGHGEVVEILLTSGAAVNCKTTDKLSALHYAASRGYADIAKVLIAHGSNVDSLDATDRTPLKLAVSRNLYDVAKVLVDSGARVNLEDIKGYTPLCEAVWQKSVKMAKMLLQSGAKLTPTPYLLHYAVLHQHHDMVELLLQYGSLVNIRDNHGDTPLMTAAVTGQTNIVKILLRYGANVDCFALAGERTPLYSVVAMKERTNPEVVKALVEGGADINRVCWNETPLSSAIISKKQRIAGLLIGLGADVHKNAPMVNGPRDAMKLARLCDTFFVVRMLVYAGYDIHKKLPDITPPINSEPDVETIDGWLQYYKYNPLNLTDLVRIKIRSLAGGMQIPKFVEELHLPPFLVKFLLMENSPSDKEVLDPVTPPKPKVFFPVFEF